MLEKAAETSHTPDAADEADDNDQKKYSSLAGKKRKERLALLHGFVFRNWRFL